jgi:uncharacterized protein
MPATGGRQRGLFACTPATRLLHRARIVHFAPPAYSSDFYWSNLRWLLLSEPLLCTDAPVAYQSSASIFSWAPTEAQQVEQWLDTLDADHLRHWIGPSTDTKNLPLRLGRFAERLLHYALLFGPTHELLAAHLPIRNDQQQGDHTTLGELDYLVRNRLGEVAHWELAIKFYLAQPGNTAGLLPDDYIGPDKKDSLALKLGKLFGRQLCQPLPHPWCEQAVQRQAFTKGRLFYPWETNGSKALQPWGGLNPQHHRGWWITARQLPTLPTGHYLPLARLEWLMNQPFVGAKDVIAQEALPAWFDQQQINQLGMRAQLLLQVDAPADALRHYFVRPD